MEEYLNPFPECKKPKFESIPMAEEDADLYEGEDGEISRQSDAFIGFLKTILQQRNFTFMINPQRIEEMKTAYKLLKKSLSNSNRNAKMDISDTSELVDSFIPIVGGSGSIDVTDSFVEFSDREIFSKAIILSDSFIVDPLLDGNIEISFNFRDVLLHVLPDRICAVERNNNLPIIQEDDDSYKRFDSILSTLQQQGYRVNPQRIAKMRYAYALIQKSVDEDPPEFKYATTITCDFLKDGSTSASINVDGYSVEFFDMGAMAAVATLASNVKMYHLEDERCRTEFTFNDVFVSVTDAC